MRRTALPLASLALLVGLLVLPAVASPQPRSVCGPCGGGLDRVASDPPYEELDVVSSAAVVRVHEDGSATWHVTNRISNGTAAAYLREHPDSVERIVRKAIGYDAIDAEFRNVSASIDGTTVTVTFEDPAAARRMHGGVLVNEYFHSRGYDRWSVITADRITVVGPPGTVVTNDPAGAEVEGRNATWRGDASVRLGEGPRVDADAYVAFGDGDAASRLWTAVDLRLATLPIVLDVVLSFFLLPLVLFGLLLGSLVAVGRRPVADANASLARVSLVVAGLGLALIVVAEVGGIATNLFGEYRAVGVGAVYLAMGGAAYWRGDDTRPRILLAAGALAVVVVAAGLAVADPGADGAASLFARVTAIDVVYLFPIATAPLLGAAAVGGSRRETASALLATVGAFVAFELSVVWPTERPFGLVVLVFFLAAVLVTLGAIPPFVLGGAAARREETRESD